MDGGEESESGHGDGGFTVKDMLWHGGSVWDAWFSCASNQVRPSVTSIFFPVASLRNEEASSPVRIGSAWVCA